MAWTTSYYHYDAVGTTRQLTDNAEAVTDTYLNDAFGNQLSKSGTTTNPFRYVGQAGYYFDGDIGTTYVRERIYSPVIIRWLSEDPIGFTAADWNLFRYVANKSVRYRDPSGKDIFDVLLDLEANPRSVGTLRNLLSNPIDTVVSAADRRGVETITGLCTRPLDTIRDAADPIGMETLKSLFEDFWGTLAKHANPGPGVYFGAEIHFIVGIGATEVLCVDACKCKYRMRFVKFCVGLAAGAGVGVGPVNMSGQRCDPSKYVGWFAEGAIVPGVGPAVDVGLNDLGTGGTTTLDDVLTEGTGNFGDILPGGRSGTIEGGVSGGIGYWAKASLCRYYLVEHKRVT